MNDSGRLTVNLIGAGRVGRTLLRLFADHPGVTLGHVASGRFESAAEAVREAGAGEAVALQEMAPADLWVLTVPDSAIGVVAAELAALDLPAAMAVHCSGYHAASVMEPLGARGWRLASAHPMMSFADPEVSAARFSGKYVGLEGDAEATGALERLFAGMGARCFAITSEGKALYHAAAVFTNNFTTVLQAVALEAWEKAGVPEGAARELNATLLASTVENLVRMGPAEALTGPAARGDRDVVEAQGAKVAEWHPEAGRLYDILSAMAARLKAEGRTQGPRR